MAACHAPIVHATNTKSHQPINSSQTRLEVSTSSAHHIHERTKSLANYILWEPVAKGSIKQICSTFEPTFGEKALAFQPTRPAFRYWANLVSIILLKFFEYYIGSIEFNLICNYLWLNITNKETEIYFRENESCLFSFNIFVLLFSTKQRKTVGEDV